MKKLDLLREALPYIRRFQGRIFVVKLSGKVTGDPDALASLADEIALCQQVGFRMLVVHGGGKQLTELATRLGIEQSIINGRRVTCSETLEVAKMVLAGQVRTDVVSVLRKAGVPTVGLSGLDGNIVGAKRRRIQQLVNHETGQDQRVDFGHVGDIVEIDTTLLQLMMSNGYVPVVASLGADEEGNVYNINADTIATEIAIHLQAEKLFLLSDVPGILRDPRDAGTRISSLTLQDAEQLLESGKIGAGMLPKLAGIVSLLKRGGKSAHIISGLRRNALLQEIFTHQGSGTMVAYG